MQPGLNFLLGDATISPRKLSVWSCFVQPGEQQGVLCDTLHGHLGVFKGSLRGKGGVKESFKGLFRGHLVVHGVIFDIYIAQQSLFRLYRVSLRKRYPKFE